MVADLKPDSDAGAGQSAGDVSGNEAAGHEPEADPAGHEHGHEPARDAAGPAAPPAARAAAPVLPEQSREDTDAAWGEYPESADDRLYRDRPPHWDNS